MNPMPPFSGSFSPLASFESSSFNTLKSFSAFLPKSVTITGFAFSTTCLGAGAGFNAEIFSPTTFSITRAGDVFSLVDDTVLPITFSSRDNLFSVEDDTFDINSSASAIVVSAILLFNN